MKNLALTIILSFIASITLAQDLEKFYMPQLQSKEDCAKYIGKKVCVFDYSSSNKRWKDAYNFEEYYWGLSSHYENIYTITKIKFGEQIEIRLVSNYGSKHKVNINNGGTSDYKALSSCNIFFLYDEFETYRNEQIGRNFKNSNNEDVAVLENIELIPRYKDDPVLVSTLRSKINNEEFICFSCDVEEICKNIGVVISNPKVKDKYRVLSGHTISLNRDDFDEYKYIYAERPWYTYENITTGEIGTCSVESILTEPFEEDLSGEFADCSDFNFILQNISESSIKIVWDEAVFVNFDGSTEKVMHKGIKFSEKNGTQPATTIIKNAKWEDTVTPTHLVYYREATKYIEGGWDKYSMYPREKGLNPGQVKLMLPIQIKDVINEYVFIFDVQYVFNHPERLNLDVE